MLCSVRNCCLFNRRYLAHNGEINTLRGNVNLMAAREGVMHSTIFGDKLKKVYPVVEKNQSDSGSLDNVLEFLVMAGQRALPEVRQHGSRKVSIEFCGLFVLFVMLGCLSSFLLSVTVF